jgi:hypothetical protein
MIKVQITDGVSGAIRKHLAEVELSIERLQAEMPAIGAEAQTYVKDFIASHKVRPQDSAPTLLEDAMQLENIPVPDGAGFGVGPIDVLNTNAPHWKAVNYGSVGNMGHVVPLGRFSDGAGAPDVDSSRQGRWQVGNGKFAFVAKQPIPAMNYIEAAINWLDNRMNSFLNKFMNINSNGGA